ncbi:MAG: Rhomboid family protein [Myxococcales bacterium]|nr:Rhomboid family protein [Myxococcales bacterium]
MDSELGLLYELALISVAVGGGYWGWFFTTRRPHGSATYGVMQLACAVLAALGLIGRHEDVAGLGIVGAIGVGGGTCLLLLGPLVRTTARWLASLERFTAANRLLDVADILAPGSGVAEEKALLGAMREIRDGKIEPTVDALTVAKQRAPAEAKLAIDERIAMLYLAAYRWDDAIAHAEENLFGAVPPTAEPPANPGLALRRALGVAPPVWVELLGAYGRKGNLDQAARMLARLEDVCQGRAEAAIWLHRGRLMFLALAGRVTAVQELLEPKRSRYMNPGSRTYWLAVAHERGGNGAAAEAAYAKARSRSRGRPREMIDRALAGLASARPAELGAVANEVISRVEASPVPQVTDRGRRRGPVATWSLIAVIALVAGTMIVAVGATTDVGVLMRSGAVVRGLVRGGEWWRLVACVFIHVGAVHLVLNLVGLYFVGRLVEDLFGPVRTVAIFGLAGLAGSTASFFASPAGMSAGASGAIFGLLGALFFELTWHRKRYRSAWNRGMWGSIALVTVAQLGIDFVSPITDQWAHGAGLAAGALAGLALSPNARWTKLAIHLARVFAVAFAAVSLVAAVMVAHTSITESLSSLPTRQFTVGKIAVTAPATWSAVADELYDPDLLILVSGWRSPGDLAPNLATYMASEATRAKSQHFEQIETASDHVVPLPLGWEGSELTVALTDALGSRQHYRVVIAGHAVPNVAVDSVGSYSGAVLVSLYVPETVARAAPAFFTKLLGSVE